MPPKPPVSRWWTYAHGPGLHDLPVNVDEMQDALYNTLD
jgi:hypothetical protein